MDWSKFESGAIKSAVKGTQTQHLSKTTHLERHSRFHPGVDITKIYRHPTRRLHTFVCKKKHSWNGKCVLSGNYILETIILTCANGLWSYSAALQGEHPSFGEEKARTDGVWCPTSVPWFEKLGRLVDIPERICFINYHILYKYITLSKKHHRALMKYFTFSKSVMFIEKLHCYK